jgi:hypothetical protein
MFLKDIWPKARIGLYCEWYREQALAAEGFDPEFPVAEQETAVQRLRSRNLNAAPHVDKVTTGITPTRIQFASYPKVWQDMASVIFDGIDTRFVCPNPDAALEISVNLTLTRNDETGVLVDFFDQDALLSQLIWLFKDAGPRARLGGAARQHIRQHHDLRTICLPQQLRWVDVLGHSGPQAHIA